jgi:hypothetical protein
LIKMKKKINIFFIIINKDHILYITDNTSIINVIKIGGLGKNVPNKCREARNTFYVKYTFCLRISLKDI